MIAGDRRLILIAALAACLHVAGMARAPLPAQDGLKYLRFARQMQRSSVIDAIRGSDRHPLYPSAIALVQPLVHLAERSDSDSWRIAAQLVSAIASIALLWPLHRVARSLFDESVADLAALLWVLLPIPGELGHDSLSDPLALLAFAWALRFGETALRTERVAAFVACGVISGIGYLARPEVACVPLALLAAFGFRALSDKLRAARPSSSARPAVASVAVFVPFLCFVGVYALAKGEVSEKLALRRSVALSSDHGVRRSAPQWLPKGLDNPKLDFSPKEESGRSARVGWVGAFGRLIWRWSEAMGWVLAPLALWGAIRVRPRAGPLLFAMFVAVFGLILIRHQVAFGYLSARHALSLALVCVPWSAAAIVAISRGLASRMSRDPRRVLIRRRLALAAIIAVGVVAQSRPGHPSRWGHGEAGRWLARNQRASEAALDTRGWASFVSGGRSYDYWHVRQALSDASLAYIVVESAELDAPTARAKTLRAVLAYACRPAASFPLREGGTDSGVRIYRFDRPESWEGLRL